MSSQIAALVYGVLILGLFWLDRDPRVKTSPYLWLAVVWLALAGSRGPAQWLQMEAPGSSDEVMEGNPFDRNVYTGLLAAGLIVLIIRRKRVAKLLQANLPVVVFFLYCLVSLFWSDYPDIAFKRWTKALGDFFMVLIVLSDDEPFSAIKRLLARTSYLLIPLSVLFIKYYPELGKGYGTWDYKAHYTGVTTNKNALGAICLFFGVTSLWRLAEAYKDKKDPGRKGRMIAQCIIVALVLWLFWMANSMTSWSCFLMASALLFATNLRIAARKPAMVHLMIALVILVPFSTLFLGVGAGVAQGAISRDLTTLTDRTDIWKLVIAITPNRLFGAGFESFWLGPKLEAIYRMFPWRPNQAHNGYLEIYANLGWTGLALLAVVLVTGYRKVIAAFRRNLPAARLMVAFFAVGIIYNFTEAALFRMMALTWILLLLTITRIPEPVYRESRMPQRRSPQPRFHPAPSGVPVNVE